MIFINIDLVIIYYYKYMLYAYEVLIFNNIFSL